MQDASRTQNASVAEWLYCKGCGRLLIKEGKIVCPRCDQETPAVLVLGKKEFRCPHCQEQGYRDPRCLAKEDYIKCPDSKCQTLNYLIKEETMPTDKVTEVLEMVKNFSPEERKELTKELKALEKKEDVRKTILFLIEHFFVDFFLTPSLVILFFTIETPLALPISFIRNKKSWVLGPWFMKFWGRVFKHSWVNLKLMNREMNY